MIARTLAAGPLASQRQCPPFLTPSGSDLATEGIGIRLLIKKLPLHSDCTHHRSPSAGIATAWHSRSLMTVIVHLTWSRAAEQPPWPSAEIFLALASTVASMTEHGS
jgi:hypothetical protein